MSNLVYEASVYAHTLTYKNFKGETRTSELYFALDPLQLLAAIANYTPRKVKSGNPALNGQAADMTDEEQIKLVRGLASKAAGTPSDDGESWIPFEDFGDSIAGKAFLTKLVTSDEERRKFSEQVMLDPMRAYVGYAMEDASNSPKELQELKDMLHKMENIFKSPEVKDESPEDRRARLKAELESLETPAGTE